MHANFFFFKVINNIYYVKDKIITINNTILNVN